MAISIEIDAGAGPRVVTVEPGRVSLGVLEDIERAQESGKWRDLIGAVAGLLGLSRDEARALTVEQFREIAQSIGGAAIPNASAPGST